MRSSLRSASNASKATTATTRSNGQPCTPDLVARVALPAEGAVSVVWLERALAAEREALAQFVAHRYDTLLADIQAKLTDEKDTEQAVGLRHESQVEGHITPADPRLGNDADQVKTISQVSWSTRPPSTGGKLAWEERALPGSTEADESVSLPGDELAHMSSGGVQSARLSELKRTMSRQRDSGASNSAFSRLVRDWRFEFVVACVILCNAVVMAFEMQYDGMERGYELGYRWYSRPDQTWPGAVPGFSAMDYIFGCLFTLELVLKVLGQKAAWLRDPWNYLDLAIVALWLIEKPLSGTIKLPDNTSFLRTARLFRLLRLVKLLRTLHGLESLYIMLTTLKGCFSILGWSCALLLVTQLLIAMLFSFVLHEAYLKDDNYPLEERKEVFQYFGTMSRAMLTMFEMTLANWPPVCRLLLENVNEWFSLFCILHKLTMGFAVIGVINGVFMQETFKVAATDDYIMLQQREREVKVHTAKMERLFQAADDSGDGVVDVDEFRVIMQDKEILFWLSSLDIAVRDPVVLFNLLDKDGSGELTCEEFVKGGLMLRGPAKSIDVMEMKAQLREMKQFVR